MGTYSPSVAWLCDNFSWSVTQIYFILSYDFIKKKKSATGPERMYVQKEIVLKQQAKCVRVEIIKLML